MFNIPILDVFIGLVFIYLIYGLMITVINEIINSLFGMRARQLEKAIKIMLEDQPKNYVFSFKSVYTYLFSGILKRLNFVRFFFIPKKLDEKRKENAGITKMFYDQPVMQKLGKSRLFSKPSYIKAETFSASLLELLKKNPGATDLNKIEKSLTVNQIQGIKLGPETAGFIRELLEESKGNLEDFRKRLENWFDTTMERVTGWYKRMSQRYAFVIGLLIAMTFNVDTISIVRMLSTDKSAREQIVNMASDYITNHPDYKSGTPGSDSDYVANMDSLVKVADTLLNQQIYNTSNILGMGWVLPTTYQPRFEFTSLKYNKAEYKLANKVYDRLLDKNYRKEVPAAKLCWCDKSRFLLCMIFNPLKFLGFLLTAFAMTLGAPFWFDILKRLVSIRSTGTKPEVKSSSEKK